MFNLVMFYWPLNDEVHGVDDSDPIIENKLSDAPFNTYAEAKDCIKTYCKEHPYYVNKNNRYYIREVRVGQDAYTNEFKYIESDYDIPNDEIL